MVHLKGLEPSRWGHQILSLARLPIPPQAHIVAQSYEEMAILANFRSFSFLDVLGVFLDFPLIFLGLSLNFPNALLEHF